MGDHSSVYGHRPVKLSEYEPLPWLRPFHASSAKYRSIVGGRGCGKTMAGVTEACRLARWNDRAIISRTIPHA